MNNEVILHLSFEEADELVYYLNETIDDLTRQMTDYDVKAGYSDSAWDERIRYKLESQDVLYKIKQIIENQLYEDE